MDGCGASVVLVEPFGVGGGVDVIASALSAMLTQIWAVPVTVDNRPGLGARAAPALVAAAAPDGRTLLISTSAHAYSAALAIGLPYDPIADFVPVAPVTSQPYVLVAPGRSGIRSLRELISTGEARPLSFVSAGVGTGTHLSVAELNLELGISATHLPARPKDAVSATIARVAAGEADYAMSPISIAQPHLGEGTLVALGVSGAQRSQLLPDVLTLQEAGAADFDFPIWYGIWAPSATPAARVEELTDGIGAALDAPELRSWLGAHGAEPMRMTQREFADFVIRERDRAHAIARAAGISPTR
ncbi:MAG: tripartite tricarboxylate transporter substrate-binding protein [Actinomycetota bacterium]|nr:tripartite tricarboxylate transporter substrate-binding protein [Actinomycetota bacterium]